MKKVNVNIDGRWIMDNRDVIDVPSKKCVDAIKEVYEEAVKISKVGISNFELQIDTDRSIEDVRAMIADAISKTLGVSNIDEIVKIQLSEVATEEKEEKEESASEEKKAAAPAPKKAHVEEKKEEVQHKKGFIDQAAVDEIMKQIDAMVGAADFKNIAHELISIAPQIHAHDTYDTLMFQNYLMSINDGCGLTMSLNLMADLLSALGLMEFGHGKQKVVELRAVLNSDHKEESLLKVVEPLQSKGQIICIDISAYMQYVNSSFFRKFLRKIEDIEENYLFVFRVPFIEPQVLENIRKNIDDVLFTRSMLYIPFNNQELHNGAEVIMKDSGYTLDEAAWEIYDERIIEEKSDGRFYGFSTLKKVAKEMIYRKQLANTKNNKDDCAITAADIEGLSSTHNKEHKTGEQMLDELVGMDDVKKRLREIVAQIEVSVKSGDKERPCIHMRFLGNPGTGKTTVARILGKMLTEKGILREGAFFEHGGRDFCGEYIGQTAPKTLEMCREAYGSVLFVDEAYTLYNGADDSRDYGKEALATLIAEMENHRDDMIVIMAGYTDDMKTLMKGNAGLASRMPYAIEFVNYNRDELSNIFLYMAGKHGDLSEDLKSEVRDYFSHTLSDAFIESKEFANARYVRNLYERAKGKAIIRSQMQGSMDYHIEKEDFLSAISDQDIAELNDVKEKRRIGF